MILWLVAPFALQAGLILVDEFHFHWRRGLPRWEIWGHPLDTFFSLLPFLFASLARPDSTLNLNIYGALAVWSCLFVTKDEFIHREVCPAGEAWVHSALFILHPLTFVAAAWAWTHDQLPLLLPAQTALMFVFMVYQILAWGFLWRSRVHRDPTSTTTSTKPTEIAGTRPTMIRSRS